MKFQHVVFAGCIIGCFIGCIILGLIFLSCMGNASVPQAKVYISDTSVIAVDGQSNVISRGTLGVDDTTVLQAAFNALQKSNGQIVISPGLYQIGKAIRVDGFYNLKITANGATLKMKSNFASDTWEFNGVYLINCEKVSMSGLTVDGNKNNLPADQDNSLIAVANTTDTLLYNCTITNAVYKGLNIKYKPSYNLTVDHCHFINNCDEGTDSDVYCTYDFPDMSYTFSNCNFERATLYLNKVPIQAFYMGSGIGTYINNTFKNMMTCYDFRHGIHTIKGSSGTNNGLALVTQIGDDVKVTASDMYFTGLTGHAGDMVSGVHISSGSVSLNNLTLIAATSNIAAKDGIRIRDGGRDCKITNCYIKGFDMSGIYVYKTTGQTLFEGNTIVGDGNGYGIYTLYNTGNVYVRNNVASNVESQYENSDGKLVVQPNTSPTPTPTVTTNFMAGPNLAPTPLAPQDNSATTNLPASVRSGLVSLWSWDKTKQYWGLLLPHLQRPLLTGLLQNRQLSQAMATG